MFELQLTQAAKTKIQEKNMPLKITVVGGGCSGFQYILEWVKPDYASLSDANSSAKNALTYQDGDIIVQTDAASIEFIQGSILDFKEDLIGSRFLLKNPNATISCGCGKSFS